MVEKAALKAMKCPTCGATLKAANAIDPIACVYCGNTIVPVFENTNGGQQAQSAGFNGVLKVEGIKTSSSALAYIELFFEEYDWENFAYAQTLSIAEIDKLVNSLKASSADDKNTWFACFKAISVPFIHKVKSCQEILETVIEEYKDDNLDSYSKFDAYKRLANMIVSRKQTLVEELQKITNYAQKYGASTQELGQLQGELGQIIELGQVVIYDDIQQIPAIDTFIQEKNIAITKQLAAKGINAQEEYAKAKALMGQKHYVEALNNFLLLKGYADADDLAKKLDKYFLISDVLEIEDTLYYFSEETSEYDSASLSLYPTVDGKIASKPLIKNIGKIITNYADILYYLDNNGRLKKYDFSINTETTLFDKTINRQSIFVYNKKVFLLAEQKKGYDEYSPQKFDLLQLQLATGAVDILMYNLHSILSLTGNKMVYIMNTENNQLLTNILNVDTRSVISLGMQRVQIEGFINQYVVYTKENPNQFNKNLYVKNLDDKEPEQLIEKNIFTFCAIVANKLFYYVGNTRNQTLININPNGTQRTEWPLYIRKVLFEQGGWVYFIRKAGYNSILCKARPDGSKFSVIAADIEEFVQLKNGYLYYINDEACLVKVRMDGSNLQILCDDVESVLSVKDDKIIFISVDDRITTQTMEGSFTQKVKSIYAVDFSGSGKIKLAYNIEDAKKHDDDMVYYIASHDMVKALYKLNVKNYMLERALTFQVQEEPKPSGCGFAIAMFMMFVGFILFFVGLGDEETYALSFLGILTALISMGIGISIRKKNKQNQ